MLSGVAIGVSSMICPVYIAEIAPPSWRGRLGTLFQLGIVIGIFLTLFINGKIQSLGDPDWNVRLGWRWMLAAEAIPALLLLGLLLAIPESPKWLIQADREEEARQTLTRVGGTAYADAEVAAVREVLEQEEGSFSELFSRLPPALADRPGFDDGRTGSAASTPSCITRRTCSGPPRATPTPPSTLPPGSAW